MLALLVSSSMFGTIDHSILAHYADFGFIDTVFQWSSSYLANHTQYASLSNVLLLLLYI